MSDRLKNKVAIVTGAGSGIGRAITLALAREGADVIGAARRIEKLNELSDAIKTMGRQYIPLHCDVSVKSDCDMVIQRAIDDFGKVDVLVNNASVYPVTKFLDITPEEWNKVVAINLTGAVFMCQAVLPHMVRRQSGKIIMINSSQIRRSPMTVWHMHYIAAKMGILGLTRGLAAEFGPSGIQVNGIAPGYTPETEQARQYIEPFLDSDPSLRERGIATIPLRRDAKVGDYEGIAVFLASSESDYITGQTISVDGGITMQG